MAKEYVGRPGVNEILTLFKTALAGKQDKMEEITPEEVQELWDEVCAEMETV